MRKKTTITDAMKREFYAAVATNGQPPIRKDAADAMAEDLHAVIDEVLADCGLGSEADIDLSKGRHQHDPELSH